MSVSAHSDGATPAQQFTDTHVHFWDQRQPGLIYSWLALGASHPVAGNYDAIKAIQYLPSDFLGEARFTSVAKVVHVQAAVGSADPVVETQWLQAQSAQFSLPMTLIASANLADPSLPSVLERHLEAGRVCGVRDLRYDDYLNDPRWRRGYARLREYGLVFCDDPHLDQMADAARLAARCPETIYCVDHAGVPARRDRDYFNRWRQEMRRLASVANTVVKVSGLGMADQRWTTSSLRDWVLECVEMWGPARVVFGSNWPCDRVYSSYGDLWDAYCQLLSSFSPYEQHQMLASNADRLFRLEPSALGTT